ncbi:hypothetical protein AFK68_13960 [Hydrocoleum sp. CS-953]|uniref:hypothetical protein n=1 Tax=Hydrocoleum sp. CS-953 TaxID=1671698 RepID=UPI000BD4F1ED|nr:hypothetical protein [Hydrocoleum sp. CS-953]OZH53978.1 hypothetical protein AFK68_13960 [Hydrocoleum sp. CS-953]
MSNFNATSGKNNSAKAIKKNEAESRIWDSLKQAIALTSGFQRWQLERNVNNNQQQNIPLDRQVSLYLRETLETLAY